VDFIKSKYEPVEYDYSVTERPGASADGSAGGGIADEDSDPLIPDAKEEILRAGKASASLLQRRLKVGYARAARLLDLLEQEGFIGPGDGAKPREILKGDSGRQGEASNRTIPVPSPVKQEEEEVSRHRVLEDDEGVDESVEEEEEAV
jgi:S-DNA-T family DNA segregation ATPase FtsK/SpoIIIE